MHSVNVALVVLACSFGGALCGLAVGARLPSHHLSDDTKRVVDLGMGLVATLSGLVLGLLVSTSNSAFAAADTQVKEMSAKMVQLDHVLARYGPETSAARAQLRRFVEIKINEIWSREVRGHRGLETPAGGLLENTLDRLGDLSPSTPAQHALKDRALALATDISQARWLLIEGNAGSVLPTPFLAIVIFWLIVLFFSFGLFAPRNAIAIAALLVCALSVATALFLVLELSRPFGGVIQISSAPARNALANMGR